MPAIISTMLSQHQILFSFLCPMNRNDQPLNQWPEEKEANAEEEEEEEEDDDDNDDDDDGDDGGRG